MDSNRKHPHDLLSQLESCKSLTTTDDQTSQEIKKQIEGTEDLAKKKQIKNENSLQTRDVEQYVDTSPDEKTNFSHQLK